MEQMLRSQVRLPRDIADWLKSQARSQSRSMNGQLIEVLKNAKKCDEQANANA